MKKIRSSLLWIVFAGISAVLLAPVLFLVTGSLMTAGEFARTYGGNLPAFPAVVPRMASPEQYGTLLLNTPGYLIAFWNTLLIAVCIGLGQIAVGLPCAFAMAKGKIRCRVLFFLYIVMMMMPFQVTMLPMYRLVKWFGMFDSRTSLIIPEIFAPFTVFLLVQFIRKLPDEMMEAAYLETKNPMTILCRVVAPLVRPGINAALILSFVETWNMVEKPLLYLTSEELYPLGMLLSKANQTYSVTAMAGSVLYILPVYLLWYGYQDEICQSIANLNTFTKKG